jgi:RNA polymerase sigma factor (sigma-70 family)
MNEFDNAFIALIQTNAPEAVEKAARLFYKHYEKAIANYARKSKVVDADATTIIADTFLDLVETIKSNTLESNCQDHIWKKAKRLISKALRDQQKEHRNTVYPEAWDKVPAYHLHDETSRFSVDLLSDERFLNALSPKEAQLIKTYLNGTTRRTDIANAIGEKETTVRQRWNRLLDKLRDLFAAP